MQRKLKEIMNFADTFCNWRAADDCPPWTGWSFNGRAQKEVVTAKDESELLNC